MKTIVFLLLTPVSGLLATSYEIKQAVSPLHLAAERGDDRAIKGILDNQENLIDSQDSDGLTPLHKAAMAGKTDSVEYLLILGASPDKQSSSGQLPEDIARSNGHVALSDFLKEFRTLDLANSILGV